MPPISHEVTELRSAHGHLFRVACSCGDGVSPKGTITEREEIARMWTEQHFLMNPTEDPMPVYPHRRGEW